MRTKPIQLLLQGVHKRPNALRDTSRRIKNYDSPSADARGLAEFLIHEIPRAVVDCLYNVFNEQPTGET